MASNYALFAMICIKVGDKLKQAVEHIKQAKIRYNYNLESDEIDLFICKLRQVEYSLKYDFYAS